LTPQAPNTPRRNFDVPFLVTRSLLLGVPARVDLLGKPYELRPHLDLYRLLQPGRALGPAGLDVLCWALGVESPKGTLDVRKTVHRERPDRSIVNS